MTKKKPSPKFDTGDMVRVVNPERWAYSSVGLVSGIFPTEKGPSYYLIKLFDSPSPYISTSYVLEEDIQKED